MKHTREGWGLDCTCNEGDPPESGALGQSNEGREGHRHCLLPMPQPMSPAALVITCGEEGADTNTSQKYTEIASGDAQEMGSLLETQEVSLSLVPQTKVPQSSCSARKPFCMASPWRKSHRVLTSTSCQLPYV